MGISSEFTVSFYMEHETVNGTEKSLKMFMHRALYKILGERIQNY